MTVEVLSALVAVGVDVGEIAPLDEGYTGAFVV